MHKGQVQVNFVEVYSKNCTRDMLIKKVDADQMVSRAVKRNDRSTFGFQASVLRALNIDF